MIVRPFRTALARTPADSRVVLFGSRARQHADDGSDYDVLVIEPHVHDAAREAVRLRRELCDGLAPIDVVVVDRELARRRASVRGTLVERALREAVCLSTPEETEGAGLLVSKAASDLAAARSLG